MPKTVKVEKSRLYPAPFFVWYFWRNALDWQLSKNGEKFWAIVALIYKCLYVVAYFVFRQFFKMSDLYVKIYMDKK